MSYLRTQLVHRPLVALTAHQPGRSLPRMRHLWRGEGKERATWLLCAARHTRMPSLSHQPPRVLRARRARRARRGRRTSAACAHKRRRRPQRLLHHLHAIPHRSMAQMPRLQLAAAALSGDRLRRPGLVLRAGVSLELPQTADDDARDAGSRNGGAVFACVVVAEERNSSRRRSNGAGDGGGHGGDGNGRW